MDVTPVVPAEQVSRWEVEADVVVVGAGGCGVTAALAAGERGASVLLVDRDHRPVANTARSGGMIPAAGTKLQRAAGIEETPEQFAADILAKNHRQSDPAQTLHLARTAAALVDWLVERHQVRLELATDFLYPGHTQYRMHCPPERTGAALLADLKRAAREAPTIQYVPDVVVENLVADARGAVVGVVADSGRREAVRARKVILACNGFGANAAVVPARPARESAGGWRSALRWRSWTPINCTRRSPSRARSSSPIRSRWRGDFMSTRAASGSPTRRVATRSTRLTCSGSRVGPWSWCTMSASTGLA
jgi:succinate dehydrogenase/fumarate reductase flavoprotein subunit